MLAVAPGIGVVRDARQTRWATIGRTRRRSASPGARAAGPARFDSVRMPRQGIDRAGGRADDDLVGVGLDRRRPESRGQCRPRRVAPSLVAAAARTALCGCRGSDSRVEVTRRPPRVGERDGEEVVALRRVANEDEGPAIRRDVRGLRARAGAFEDRERAALDIDAINAKRLPPRSADENSTPSAVGRPRRRRAAAVRQAREHAHASIATIDQHNLRRTVQRRAFRGNPPPVGRPARRGKVGRPAR